MNESFECNRPQHWSGIRQARLLALLLALTLLPWGAGQEPLSEEAQQALQQGQQRAAQAMTRYRDHYPDQPLWREAIAFGQRAQRLAPERTEPYRFLGQAYSVTGWYSRAWQSWRAYRERGGEMDAQARAQLLAAATWLGFNSFSTGNYLRAIPYLEEALALNPDDRLTLNRLTRAHLELGEPQAARPYAEKLAQLDSDARDLMTRVDEYLEHGVGAVEAFEEGEALYRAGRPGDALDRFREAVESSPDFQDALRWGGRVALELDRPGEAVGYWQRLVELEPGNEEAQESLELARNRDRYGTRAYARYREGMAAYGRGEQALARRRLEQALSESPDLADAHAWLGRIEFEEGDYSAAAEHYRQAIRLAPGETSYRFFLSATEEQIRRRQEALALEEERRRADEEEQARAEEQARVLEQARAEAAARAAAEAQARAEAEAKAQAEAQERAAQAEEEARAQAEAEEQARAEAETEAQERERAEGEAEEPGEVEAARAQERADEGARDATQERDRAAGDENVVAGAAPARAPRPAGSASPLVLADVVLSHESAEAGGSGAFSFLPGANLPENLSSPVDYAGGTLFQRLEVRSKPSDEPVHYQLCLVPNGPISLQPACSAGDRLVFESEGVFEAQQPLRSLSGYAGIDWENGMESVILVIKDPSGVPIDSRYLLGDGIGQPPDPELYYPMEVRYTAILVPENGSFPGWPD